MYWRLGPEYKRRPRDDNRRAMHSIVSHGIPPGLLAFDHDNPDRAVGWCQLTPRADLDWLDHPRYTEPVDDADVLSLSCFYVHREYRQRGVAAALVKAACEMAERANAPAVEAYPVDTDVPGSTSNVFTGTVAMFAAAGFVVVAARTPSRPIMRLWLT
ncbi:GNAT family N-acetyltransferase [Jatrophihabitans lederbergiae]|uniref:GNAT family N-acetyltransferase n=1 Tax=Jatrophihabitans lederbergiae TaxID=3075547 RepID=A0ABU2JG40_9ACTN|nr:GNAT family N-acetyltransferase [Jatrophihabitans sp. DSM 44399]MDT0263434.1 GNAT family N-acetyltransferase [Jatrophihabitans sp. DSM 44399]